MFVVSLFHWYSEVLLPGFKVSAKFDEEDVVTACCDCNVSKTFYERISSNGELADFMREWLERKDLRNARCDLLKCF